MSVVLPLYLFTLYTRDEDHRSSDDHFVRAP